MTQDPLPFDPLTPLDPKEVITAQAVRRLRFELYSNAGQMQTSLGGGLHGHLGMLMPPDEYQRLSETPYILPNTPPPRPVLQTRDPPTAPQPHVPAPQPPHPAYTWRFDWRRPSTWLPQPIPSPPLPRTHASEETNEYKEAMATWKQELDTWTAAHAFSRRLVALLVTAVPETYLTDIQQEGLGYTRATPGDILQGLITQYGLITPEELQANRTSLHAPWDPDTPIETFFHRCKECRKFALEGNDPIPVVKLGDAGCNTFSDMVEGQGSMALVEAGMR